MPTPANDAEAELASDENEPDLHSRGDGRRARQEMEEALARLSRELCALGKTALERLELPEALLDAVVKARAMSSAPAKNRQLRQVRSELRAGEWPLIRARLAALARHGSIPASLALGSGSQASSESSAGRAQQWLVRLLGEGPDAMEELLLSCPTADRTHLRTLVRQVQKAEAARRKKAEQRLTDALESLLRGR